MGRSLYASARAWPWVALYVVLVLAPIAVVLVPPLPDARGFWVEFGVALGFVGLAMMGVQFALTARFRHVAGRLGLDAMLHFHRQAGLVAFGFVLAHPVVLILAERDYLSFFDPRVNLLRTLALSAAIGALVLVIAATLWRRTLGIPYEWWRLSHGMLALFVIAVGLAHTLMVGHYMAPVWKRVLWGALIAAAFALLMLTRLVKPLLAARRPWRVTRVERATGDVWTLAIEAERHDGVRFEAGQCVWLTIGDSAFSLEQHPFTIASSAQHAATLEFAVRELGDFTRTIGAVPVGARAYVEGPYGAFTLPDDDAAVIVMIAGGIGITPFLSMLRTMRERGDRRRVLLVYAAASLEAAAFLDELRALGADLDLELVPLLEQAAADWRGELGRIDAARLERLLDGWHGRRTHYFVCGPEAMMDSIEAWLVARAVPLARINSERFDIA